MANESNYISTEDLKQINTALKNDTNQINSIYETKIIKALNNCQEDLKVSGLNYDEIQTTFKKAFTSMVSQLNDLTNAMDSSIIPKYEQTASSITKLFNQDFANEMSNCLNVINNE